MELKTAVARLVAPVVIAACLPLTAHATAYKCTLPGGGSTYQDTPCQNGANQQTVATNAPALVTLMADVVMLAMHAFLRREKATGRVTPGVADCINAMKGKEFDAASQKALSASMSPSDLQTANAFFDTPAGHKVGKTILAEAAKTLGEPAEAAPQLNYNEQREFAKFLSTSAGQLLIDRKFIANSELAPAVNARLEELKRSCGAHH